ncbi:MAG: hypothetical protein AAGB00_02490 [Planctomycetota bacterium]
MPTAPLTAKPPRCAAVVAVLLLAGVVESGAAAPSITGVSVGVGGAYKLGAWAPVTVEAADAKGLSVEVVAPDNDAMRVTYAGGRVDQHGRAEALIRVGRRGAPIRVSLVKPDTGDGGRAVATREFLPKAAANPRALRPPLGSTDRLIVEVASSPVALTAPTDQRLTETVRLDRLAALPTTEAGFEAIDLVIVSLADASVFADASSPQVAALTSWVESGGRLLLAGASAAPAAIGEQGPLAGLTPGRFERLVTLTDPSSFERYAEAELAVAGGRRVAIPVAKLTATEGRVEARGGGRKSDLPLVVRAPRGLGEVGFIAADLTAGPLAAWGGRGAVLARVARLEAEAPKGRTGRGSAVIGVAGYTDLSGALQQRLGSRFDGVATSSMAAVVATGIAYLLLIGPADYFLLKLGVRRFSLTWVTFPAAAGLVAGTAYALSATLGGTAARVNQIELVDVDVASGVVRGRLWAQAYAPAACRHDVGVAPRGPGGAPLAVSALSVSWLGKPGAGLGGLDRTATDSASDGFAYRQSSTALTGLPINVRSTKALAAAWRAEVSEAGAEAGLGAVAGDLDSSAPGVLEGVVTNGTGARLTSAWLAFGDWAWRLGELDPGDTVALDEVRPPVKLKSLIRNDYVTPGAEVRANRVSSGPVFDVRGLDLDGLLHLMMFADALGGPEFTGLPNDFQRGVDLSPQLDQGRAVLVTRVDAGPGRRNSELLSGGKSWAPLTDADRTYYRFVLPVRAR